MLREPVRLTIFNPLNVMYCMHVLIRSAKHKIHDRFCSAEMLFRQKLGHFAFKMSQTVFIYAFRARNLITMAFATALLCDCHNL